MRERLPHPKTLLVRRRLTIDVGSSPTLRFLGKTMMMTRKHNDKDNRVRMMSDEDKKDVDELCYAVLCIDPPWPKKKGGIRKARPNQGRSLDYATMSVEGIFELLDKEVFPVASEQHTAFVWGVDQFLHDGENAMRERGYRMHARLVWDKENGIAPAFSLRYSHEYVTWWYKPKFMKVANDARGKFRSVIREPAREHSRKPDGFYEVVDSWFPDVRKLDVFSREPRPGWEQWGNQTEYFAA